MPLVGKGGMRADGCRFKDKGFVFLALNPGWVDTDLAGEGMGSYVSTITLDGCESEFADEVRRRR